MQGWAASGTVVKAGVVESSNASDGCSSVSMSGNGITSKEIYKIRDRSNTGTYSTQLKISVSATPFDSTEFNAIRFVFDQEILS